MKRTTEQHINYELSPAEVKEALIEKLNEGGGYPNEKVSITFTLEGGAIVASVFPEGTKEVTPPPSERV